ncbi:MAG: T9SS type A sorting domain-containing protein [Flavobacterium sp.]|nr:T9SS type A sorting domain-containing protein [Flavobacterium sp.]
MYKITICFLLFSLSGFGQNIQFADPDLLTYLTTRNCVDTNDDGVFDSDADLNNDGQIQVLEAQQVTSFSFTTMAHGIQSLSGFEQFANLQHLRVTTIDVTHMDFSVWPSLQSLRLSSSIDSFVFNNPMMTHFELQNVGFDNPLFDLTNLPNLEYVKVISYDLTDNLIFGTHNNLEELRIHAGDYSTLNLAGMPALKYLTIANFTGQSIDISNSPLLEEFIFRYTDILQTVVGINASPLLEIVEFIQEDYSTVPSNLDVAFNNQNLVDVHVAGAHSVSVTNNNSIIGNLMVNNVQLVTIDNCDFGYISSDLDSSLSIGFLNPNQISLTNIEGVRFLSLTNLPVETPLDLSTVETENLSIFNSSLTELNLKNGNLLEQFYLDYDSNVQFICIDRDELPAVESGVVNSDTPPVINSYCSFVLGGEYYEVAGDVQVDFGSGCSTITNGPVFDLQLTVTDGVNSDIFYTDNQNAYSFTLPEGNHVLSSQLSNLDYWTVSPSSINLSFPTDVSPTVQNYCVTPIGIFNDAEIYIIPINDGVPGFQSNFKIVYKNNGTSTLSGIIALTYDENTANFSSAIPNVSSQSAGNLSWNYANLLPFETREIIFSLLLNTPTHPDFPLNGGDIVDYTATIGYGAVDETPVNNIFTLNQTLVNSYDPNDITCLEGNTVTPEYIGNFVHYIIRFENNGTANATNVVVRDVLDAAKFDINSLVPLDASHDFYTRIVNGNEVEFIFENIQLPFDDANNDGYVFFKIKILPTLVLGDSFDNQAEIYFDYNFPIITNTETTVIEENLSIAEMDINTISVYPNPVSSVLHIKSRTGISTISIYDLNGRLLNTESAGSNQLESELNVASLSSGIYFLEVKSFDKTQLVKFVKK